MKVRSDFITNSSSSSFVMISINSPVLAEIMNRFKDALIEVYGGEDSDEIGDNGTFTFEKDSFSITGNEWIPAGFPGCVDEVPEELACLFEENNWDESEELEALIEELRERSEEIAASINQVIVNDINNFFLHS